VLRSTSLDYQTYSQLGQHNISYELSWREVRDLPKTVCQFVFYVFLFFVLVMIVVLKVPCPPPLPSPLPFRPPLRSASMRGTR
jgi:hypothetical protein